MTVCAEYSSRFALDGVPYTIYFFIGEIEKGYTGPLHAHRALVGIVYNFSNPIFKNHASPGCEKCRRKADQDAHSTGQVPITDALLARVATKALQSLDENKVEDYLAGNLHWKIKTVGILVLVFALWILR